MFQDARDLLAREVAALGYKVLPAGGTYFLNVDLTASGIGVDDMTFCTRAVEECGVAAIPLSAFYAEAPVTNVVRLCFAKKPGTIAKGVAGLARARALFAG
jgi:aspartate/methionine/tyrosine aminotransferase